jgi:hypothetical protein
MVKYYKLYDEYHKSLQTYMHTVKLCINNILYDLRRAL